MYDKLLQLCPTLCDSMNCSPPGSFVHGILQVRILAWIAVSSSRGSSRPRGWTGISYVSCIGRQVCITNVTWEVHTHIEKQQANNKFVLLCFFILRGILKLTFIKCLPCASQWCPLSMSKEAITRLPGLKAKLCHVTCVCLPICEIGMTRIVPSSGLWWGLRDPILATVVVK